MSNIEVLRPRTWEDFVGQDRLKRRLDIHVSAAKNQDRALDPIFLSGPPGFGKTSLAQIIADRLEVPLTSLTMPMSEKAIMQALRRFRGPGVFFMDEVHTLSKGTQELLLPVVERSVLVDKRGWEHPLDGITIIAATTERDKVIVPLYDRFPIKPEFSEYTDEEMNMIVAGMTTRANVRLPQGVIAQLGSAAGGVPRNAQQLVFAARDLKATGTTPTVDEILALVEIDRDGLNATHVRYLTYLAESPNGTMGLKNLEALLRTPAGVLREIERLLVDRDYISYTPSGREITPRGNDRLRTARTEVSI